MAPLIIKAESIIKENKFNITENNLDRQSAYGSVGNALIRITILYRQSTVVFTNIASGERIVKTA